MKEPGKDEDKGKGKEKPTEKDNTDLVQRVDKGNKGMHGCEERIHKDRDAGHKTKHIRKREQGKKLIVYAGKS
jgi:hypothetical protein